MSKIYQVTGIGLNEKNLQLQETIFHNANGYIGVRGTLEEGVPADFDTMRGMYINGFYDIAPMEQAEKLCNLVEDKESMLNVADTQTIEVSFDGQKFSMADDADCRYVRTLDMEKGITRREVDWSNKEGKQLHFNITRMASFEERSLFTIDYCFQSIDFSGTVEIHSRHLGLVRNYFNPNDPRLAGESHNHLKKEDVHICESGACLVSSTIESHLKVASAVANIVTVNQKRQPSEVVTYDETAHAMDVSYRFDIRPGDEVRIIKYSIFTDSIREEDCRNVADEKLSKVVGQGIASYYKKQQEYLKEFWNNSSMEIVGDGDLNESLCFNMYQLLQSAGYDGYSSIAAKGLSGEGYEGHYFWDTEMYVLPVFIYTESELAKQLLNYRYDTLNQARDRAKILGHEKGALYPWRTINGEEASTYFPLGTAQYHVNADIAYAFKLYLDITGDDKFLVDEAAEVLVETARVWADVGCFAECKDNKYCICAVTGPDEYNAIVDNNFYTNLMARENIRDAKWALEKMKEIDKDAYDALVKKIDFKEEEIDYWDRIIENMYFPYDEKMQIYPQDDGFLMRKPWDESKIPEEKRHLLYENYHPLFVYRQKMAKQADAILGMLLHSNYFTNEELKRNYDFYQTVTLHHSSLSTCIFGILASQIGYDDEAYKYFSQSARMDLDDIHNNFYAGIHAANMAGTWQGIVFGFAGVRSNAGYLQINPKLPGQWKSYEFRLQYKGSGLNIKVTDKKVEYTLLNDCELSYESLGEKIVLSKEGDKYVQEI